MYEGVTIMLLCYTKKKSDVEELFCSLPLSQNSPLYSYAQWKRRTCNSFCDVYKVKELKKKVFIPELLRLAPHSPPYQQHFSIKAGVVVVTLPAHSLLANSISNLSTTVVLSLSPISSFHHHKLLGHDDGHRRFPCTARSFFI